MKNLLKIEEALMFILCIYLFSLMDYSWWIFPALILIPDIGMVGYLYNAKTGAIAYNLFHHKGVAILIGFSGLLLNNQELVLAGLILFAHSSMDRMFGYGLKYSSGFEDTHLGNFKKKSQDHAVNLL